MPELPAMENFRRSIDKDGLNKKIVSVSAKRDRVVHADEKQLVKALTGQALREARRHGKYVFLRIGAGAKAQWLSFHCGMTGYFSYLKPDEDDKIVTKAKLLLRFGNGAALAFFDPRMFGRVELIKNPETFIADHSLGPDAADVTAGQFAAMLAVSGKPLKTLFLDQSVMAGIGNVYGDEIPFQAKLNPKRKANSLNSEEAARLYRRMTAILKTAIAKKAYLDHWDMLPRSWLVHYREDGAACPRCGGTITGYSAGGRDGYYCPACQK